MPSHMPTEHHSHAQEPTPIAPGRMIASNLPSSLPVSLTPLVGRTRELELGAELMRNPAVRLLTLSGPGGVGKTRLLLRLAEELIDDFPGGMTFVPLAPVRDVQRLMPTIADVLGIPNAGEAELNEQLMNTLNGRPHLLLLDNVEQIADGGPALVPLLAGCPALKIIVSSRVVLRITGEHELVVPPLSVPGASRSRPLEDIAESEAIALFLLRAKMVNPALTLTEDNAPAITEICQRLDGLPLAIELAAARTKILSPDALAERLSDRLQVLIGGPRDQPARLQTMRSAIAWSYDLLEPAEQQLFRQLSVFPAGFNLDAAEQVAESTDVLDGIASLVDKSLLQQPAAAEATPRFTMLETIRAFGLEQLATSGEVMETHRRHADWCIALTSDAALGMNTIPSQHALTRLEQEHDSLRSALGWLLETGEIALAAQLAVDAWWFWFSRSHLATGRYWCSRILAQLNPEPTVLWVRLNATTGWFTEAMGGLDQALAMHETGLVLARQLDDRFTLGITLYALADIVDEFNDAQRVQDLQSDVGRALGLYQEAASVFEAVGSLPWHSVTLNSMAAIYREQGDFDRATALIDEALVLSRSCHFAWSTALSLGHLARINRMRGELEHALELDRETIHLWLEIGDWWRLSRTLNELGIVMERLDQFEQATRLLGASEAMREHHGAAFAPMLTPAWERALERIHQHLSDDEFATAWNTGRTTPLPDVLAMTSQPPNQPKPDLTHDRSATASLSRREMDVLRLLVAGHSDRQIAETLFISHRTAQGHVANIFNKLGVNSRTAAATTALRIGLISDDA